MKLNPFGYFLHSFDYFLELIKYKKLTKDHKRNFVVLMVACILNFSFAAEKFFLAIGNPISDLTWMIVYGGLGSYLAFLAFSDYVQDLREDKDNDDGERNTI